MNSYPDRLHKRIYQYQSADERSLDTLINGNIWLSYPKSFNDPYDCDINIEDDLNGSTSNQGHNVEELKSLIGRNYSGGLDGFWDAYLLSLGVVKKIESWSNSDIASGELKEVIEHHFKSNIGVRCFFSEEPNSVQMWAHYSANHTGFCVKYNDAGGCTVPVTYSSAPHRFYLSELLFSMRNSTNHLLSTKDSGWSQERERRVFILREATDARKNGFLVPLTELSLNIEKIYVGHACNEDAIRKILQYSIESEVEVVRCTKGESGSRFDFENISPLVTD